MQIMAAFHRMHYGVGVDVPSEKCASPAHGEGPTKWEGLFRGNNAETEECSR